MDERNESTARSIMGFKCLFVSEGTYFSEETGRQGAFVTYAYCTGARKCIFDERIAAHYEKGEPVIVTRWSEVPRAEGQRMLCAKRVTEEACNAFAVGKKWGRRTAQ